jgi:Fe-S-cluster containining protein
VGGTKTSQNISTSRTRIIGLELDVLGDFVSLPVAVGQGSARLADIVPLARAVCEKITNTVTERIRRQGASIACRPGCSACCHYLVPLSIPEAVRLKEEFLKIPEPRQGLIQRLWVLSGLRILRQKPPESVLGQTTEASPDGRVDLNTVSNWYRSLKQPCPFLHEGLCTIYKIRPLACREYFVKGSEKACEHSDAPAQKIAMPLRTVEVLGQLASELEGTDVEALMLPLVPMWYADNIQRIKRTWPAAAMVERFAEVAKTIASQNSAAPAKIAQTDIPIKTIPKSRPSSSQSPYQPYHHPLDSAVL